MYFKKRFEAKKREAAPKEVDTILKKNAPGLIKLLNDEFKRAGRDVRLELANPDQARFSDGWYLRVKSAGTWDDPARMLNLRLAGKEYRGVIYKDGEIYLKAGSRPMSHRGQVSGESAVKESSEFDDYLAQFKEEFETQWGPYGWEKAYALILNTEDWLQFIKDNWANNDYSPAAMAEYAIETWFNDDSERKSESSYEKLGYEKGHKNSKGEDAPWVIRSHTDGRVLASFAKKDAAEQHLARMKRYSNEDRRLERSLEHLGKEVYPEDIEPIVKEMSSRFDFEASCDPEWARYAAMFVSFTKDGEDAGFYMTIDDPLRPKPEVTLYCKTDDGEDDYDMKDACVYVTDRDLKEIIEYFLDNSIQ